MKGYKILQISDGTALPLGYLQCNDLWLPNAFSHLSWRWAADTEEAWDVVLYVCVLPDHWS